MEWVAVLPEDGRIVAPATTGPAAWLRVLPDDAAPLVLAPGSARGWFGGRTVVTWSPAGLSDGLTLREASDELDRSFSSGAPSVTAALLPYDGSAAAARYTGGLVRTAEGWRVWGTLDADDVPAVGERDPSPLPPEVALAEDVLSDLSAAAFCAGVRAIGESIRAGDVYVLNLTRRLTGRPTTGPREAFTSLLSRTQADMAAFWQTPHVAIASASPERFVRVTGGRVQVCPIKGTRPRAEGDADSAMVAELVASEKERAEHVMIVDLERNDIGRVCRSGTVSVDPFLEVVTTAYCHQMESSVSGLLRDDVSILELLEATFPCGSVTGAPKIAAMRMIAETESSERGAYTGSLVVAVPGEMDSSVLIRTAEYAGGVVRWGTGGGITIDSDPEEEWLETVLKASPFVGDAPPPVMLRETCRVVDGDVPRLAHHLGRLAAGGCGPTVLARVRAEVGEAAGADVAHGRLFVCVEPTGLVTACGRGRGLNG